MFEALIHLKEPVAGIVSIIRPILIIFSAAELVLIIFLLKNSTWLGFRWVSDVKEITAYKAFGLHRITKEWLKIVSRLETGAEAEYKLAVIEADNMLRETFNRMGYAGESLGEQLKILTVEICPNIETVREAHKVRNNIVHDPDYRLSLDEARKIISAYEETFRHFEMI